VTGGRRLGRGLESLLGPVSREQAEAQGALRELPVAQVRPNPFQPRTQFDPAALAELVASISASGLLQPISVRSRGNGFELIAGERRLRAVQELGWQQVPAVVKDADDQTLLTLALIENLQRNDLSPIDEAQGYQRLIEQFHVGQAEVARMVAVSPGITPVDDAGVANAAGAEAPDEPAREVDRDLGRDLGRDPGRDPGREVEPRTEKES
jgi:ParB family chromosome partitioning protein